MPIETEDGLGSLIDVVFEHEHAGSGLKTWGSTYQFAGAGPFIPGEMPDFLAALALADALLHGDTTTIIGGDVNRHIAKTTQPLGDTVIYNPSNHVSQALTVTGAIPTTEGVELSHEHVVDFIRSCEFGNPGKIESRGAIDYASVDTTFGGMTFVEPGDWVSTAELWAAAVYAAATTVHAVWVLAGEPQLTKVWSVIDNVPRVVKTFGDTIIRAVVSTAVTNPRIDRNASKYFDVAP